MKEFLALLDAKTALTVAVVCATLLFLFSIIGFVGRNSYSPVVVDKMLGISDYVSGNISKTITDQIGRTYGPRFLPAGFPKTFTYNDTDISYDRSPQTLIFWAPENLDNTDVSVWIQSSSYNLDRNTPPDAQPIRYIVKLDNQKLDEHDVGGSGTPLYQLADNIRREHMNPFGIPGLHQLVVTPLPHRYKSLVTIDCLVLVTKKAST